MKASLQAGFFTATIKLKSTALVGFRIPLVLYTL